MTIKSHVQALNEIKLHLQRAPTTQLWPDIAKIVDVALALPPAVPMPAPQCPLPPTRQLKTATEALDLLYHEASITGRHSLPCDWLRDLTACERGDIATLTPAQQRAHQLLEAAIEYEKDLTSRFREYVGVDCKPEDYAHENPLAADLCKLRELLEPLRPLPPPTLEEALCRLRAAVQHCPKGSPAYDNAMSVLDRAK